MWVYILGQPGPQSVFLVVNLGLSLVSLQVVFTLGRGTFPAWSLCLIYIAISMLSALIREISQDESNHEKVSR